MMVEFAFGDTGGESNGTLFTGLPLLGGDSREYIEKSLEPMEPHSGMALWRGNAHLVGMAHSKPGASLEEATLQIYKGLLASSQGYNLYRIWNLVPQINGDAPSGLENYRAFCRGRSVAFESALGQGFASNLPAASALGTVATHLTVAFLAGTDPARHFENPAQVPAYEYPAEHGPKPPSFARATAVDSHGKLDVFISGTSAVVGHETFAPNDTARQLDCTFENLRLISKASGLGPNIGAGHGVGRHFKVYLRNAADMATVAPRMERAILRPGDRVTYLGADICRAALNVEIEVSVRGAERI
jgi:chorismate lyase / 3-hydroxybenzoate synthase